MYGDKAALFHGQFSLFLLSYRIETGNIEEWESQLCVKARKAGILELNDMCQHAETTNKILMRLSSWSVYDQECATVALLRSDRCYCPCQVLKHQHCMMFIHLYILLYVFCHLDKKSQPTMEAVNGGRCFGHSDSFGASIMISRILTGKTKNINEIKCDRTTINLCI